MYSTVLHFLGNYLSKKILIQFLIMDKIALNEGIGLVKHIQSTPGPQIRMCN